MTDIKDLINPYVWTAPEYNTPCSTRPGRIPSWAA